jgi:hypothetical protein
MFLRERAIKRFFEGQVLGMCVGLAGHLVFKKMIQASFARSAGW